MCRSRLVLRFVAALATTATVLLVITPQLLAQAWVPPAGEGTVSLGYQYATVGDHLFSSNALDGMDFGTGRPVRGNQGWFGDISGHSISFAVDYGVVRQLALSADLTFVRSMYDGPFPEDPTIDDGAFHGGFQDLRLGARYQALRLPVVLTPFASFSFPTRDYPNLGHNSIGRGLNEFQLGVALGRKLDPVLPDLYAHGRYARVFVEEFLGLNLNRHEASLEIGWFATPQWSVRGFGAFRDTDAGVDWLHDLFFATPAHAEAHFHAHDAGADIQDWTLGGGVGWAVNGLLDLSLAVSTTVGGKNTHEATAISFTTNWDIGTILRRPRGTLGKRSG